ncbi:MULTISPECIES: response regulator [Nannocystis]|uniref:Response regulator n=1 Tax=Nannocystis radixulma TaxID=2995305 RepID=A0ABT5AYC1_9BACT|nr:MULTISPECIES: response regulator [Nannocystis]MCY1054254.1 response regulator [Nannocystis sp. SCPEA4]MDC0666844.1 response regulator [Nannocystis radixulma]
MLERNPPIRTLIVDDEPLAREGIRLLLKQDADIEVIGEVGSGREAAAQIEALRPDLVFLDVQMPECTGFQVLAALPPASVPGVVFVTAFDRYALQAFEVHALDYLLKPFDDERFYEALRRAKAHLQVAQVEDLRRQLAALLADVGEARGPAPAAVIQPAERLAIKDGSRVVFLRADEIDWIEAADYYVQIHAGPKSYLHRETMQSLERRLDPAQFVRIHRSAIVNRRRIRELRSGGRREAVVVLEGGATLKVARSQRDKIASLRV